MAVADSQYRSEEENFKKSQVAWVVKNCVRCVALIMAVIFNSSCEAGMVTKEDVVLFSRVQGQVLFKGVPVSKAKVVRRYTYDTPGPVEDSCVTNDEGMFDLPAIIKSNHMVAPLVQFVVHQEIYVERNGKLQPIWSHGKMKKNENSEYGGKPKKMVCELTKELDNVKVGSVSSVYTSCVW